jgi:feruloyl esterase
MAKAYEAGDPKISAFTARGGKLLMWHGWYDPGPSPVGTIAYFDRVQAATPGASSNVRLFLAPGVYHCGGGPGPDQIDLLAALDQWVETGKAPATLLATKANAKISRPLCPYPAMPHYKGSGDPDAAASFECR